MYWESYLLMSGFGIPRNTLYHTLASNDAVARLPAPYDRQTVHTHTIASSSHLFRRRLLGICVGMQLMASRGLEHGTTDGLGWIAGDVVKLTPDDPELKIPHMGWNDLDVKLAHPLFDRIETGQHA